VKEFLPDVEHHHKQQALGMEGPNLANKCRRQILTRAPEIPLEKIKKIDNLLFKVQSSNSLKLYQIDLSTTTCNCSDFPNISLCKHIAAIVHFFGGANLGPQSPPNGSDGSASKSGRHESPGQPVSNSTMDDNATASVLLATNDIMSLSQHLMTNMPRDQAFAKSLYVIQSQFSALVHSAMAADNSSPLPEKEYIAPNQHSWPETAT